MNTFHAIPSACANAESVAGGRKTTEPVVSDQSPVLVSVGRDDAIVFSDEVEAESVPSLESEGDDEEEEEWSEEEEQDEGDDEEDTELDEGLAERLRILADARALKSLALAFLRPEEPVATTDPAAFGRDYFNRPSAPEAEVDEEAEERARVLADAMALKKSAADYIHPEVGVVATDGECLGRSFFDRYSAPGTEEDEAADERAEILAEAAALKKLAVGYMYPEVGVVSADGECFGRDYFNRLSAPETEVDEEAEERALVLADARALKKSAADYMHPEVGVVATDGECLGRSFFDRCMAPETEEDEAADERAEILAEVAALKKIAVSYMHPEVGVASADGECFGRDYFNRPSAPEAVVDEETEERARVLADALTLKKSAADYMHPEVGVNSTDGECLGRNYFARYAAPKTDEDEAADERAEILTEAAALKKLAGNYARPEAGVASTDGASFGRNYFDRPSAPMEEDAEEAKERARILADAAAMKKLAVGYMHPEVGVASIDGACFARNYFDRPSALYSEEDVLADERAEILAESNVLKKLAAAYMHPETGVVSASGASFGRNYFERPSAPEAEYAEETEERARVLAEAVALKKSAANYMHPEVGITVTDGACFGRNYFGRYSAPETEEDEMADERAEILAEAASLKKLAADYMHPETGVDSADSECFGRNYFDCYSAPEAEDEESEERKCVLAEAVALKKSAVDYMHPEKTVSVVDGACFSRNYFDRISAPDTEEDEFADERVEILAQAAALKKLAADYMHPEVGVSVSDATVLGRNFFDRHSAPADEDAEEAEERGRVLAEAAALKKSAVDYMHPEVGVASADGASFGRNFFCRFSAPEVEDEDLAAERAHVLSQAASIKKSTVGYMHPAVRVASADGACFGRNYFNRSSAPEAEEGELEEERARVLVEAAALKKSAVDYMHPEVGVVAADATSFGRNYFNRFSAFGTELHKKTSVQSKSPEASQDMAAVKNLAAAVKGANLPGTKSTKLSSADKDVGTGKKSASTVNLFGLSEEAF